MPDAESKPPRIVVTAPVSDALMEQYRATAPGYRIDRYKDEVPNSVWGDAEVLFAGTVYPAPEQAPRLRWIQTMSAGFDGPLRRPVAQLNDITLTSASGIHATAIAEFCLGMMLALNQKIPAMLDLKREKKWGRDEDLFRPPPLRGQTVGIIGYGSIGRELARLCAALGMTVLAAKRDAMKPEVGDVFTLHVGTGDPTGEIPARLYPGQAVATMARECDFLVVTVPLTDATRHTIDARVFDAMKPTAHFINIARGSIVDEPALIAALQNGDIAGAALDVFAAEPLPADSPLWTLSNVIVSPHVSGGFPDYAEAAGKVFAENLRRYVERKPLLNVLDRTRGY